LNYYIFYLTDKSNITYEFYLKGKSLQYLEGSILRYSTGVISTNKGSIYTMNFESAFLRHIPEWELNQLRKNDFAMINENRSYNLSHI
jgi:hypothetical protein